MKWKEYALDMLLLVLIGSLIVLALSIDDWDSTERVPPPWVER